jgi:hypothetical protein
VFFFRVHRIALAPAFAQEERARTRGAGAIMNRSQVEGILVAISLGAFVAYVS